MAVFDVTDPDDLRIADYRNVPDPVLLHDKRLFVAEGRHVVRRLLASKRLVTRSVMMTAAARAALDPCSLPAEVPVYIVTQDVMNSVTGFNIHRGCLALGERAAPEDWRQLAARARRLLVLERIANADNVGGIFRNALAFGADAVLLGPGCIDPLYRKAIRTSMGAAFAVPFAHVTPWPCALRTLHDDGFRVIGLSPAAPSRLDRVVPGGRVAFVAGHEGDGLTSEALDACDTTARIPMIGDVDSINVSTAMGIALYEHRKK